MIKKKHDETVVLFWMAHEKENVIRFQSLASLIYTRIVQLDCGTYLALLLLIQNYLRVMQDLKVTVV